MSVRYTAKEAAAMQERIAGGQKTFTEKKPTRNKHGNVRVINADGKFDSKKEYERFLQLRMMLRGNIIKKLERQIPFGCACNGRHICQYIADFVVTYPDGRQEIQDTKSEHTRKDPVYRLKKNIMRACNQIEIIEV